MKGIASRVLLDRYELGHKLGRGTSSTVFSGHSLRTGAPVAIKLCTQVDGQQKARFYREAELLARVMHPNVVRIVDFGQLADGTQIIVTEFIAGQPLEELLRSRGALPWREALDVIGGVFSGLEALHDAGIIHRDIKPSNVLVERGARPTVKLIDLGVSRDVRGRSNPITAAGMVVGTVAFMAPELIALEPVDERSDLYSAGVVLYEMLCGELPFTGDAAAMAADKLRYAGVSVLHRVEGRAAWPESVARFTLSLLRRKPDERPSSASECVAAVRSILVGR
ncbi:MAG: serine/threonine-protein kinase [Polyangiales bacterium]